MLTVKAVVKQGDAEFGDPGHHFATILPATGSFPSSFSRFGSGTLGGWREVHTASNQSGPGAFTEAGKDAGR
jgi:hypothetical protein